MDYIVIKAFTDKDDKHHYAVGDRFPYRGFAKKERLEELSTDKNKRGVALIAEKKPEKKEKTAIDTEEKPIREDRPRRSSRK